MWRSVVTRGISIRVWQDGIDELGKPLTEAFSIPNSRGGTSDDTNLPPLEHPFAMNDSDNQNMCLHNEEDI